MAKLEDRLVTLHWMKSHPTQRSFFNKNILFFSVHVGNFKYDVDMDGKLIKYTKFNRYPNVKTDQLPNVLYKRYSSPYHCSFIFKYGEIKMVHEICKHVVGAINYSSSDSEEINKLIKMKLNYFPNKEIVLDNRVIKFFNIND